MISKELIEKAKKCTSKEELLKLAELENIKLSDAEINNILASKNVNRELSDEELENVTGGTCYSGDTYAKLRITPTCWQSSNNNPVIVTVGNSCRLSKRSCGSCVYSAWREEVSLYCRLRSKQLDPVDDPLYVYYPDKDCIIYNDYEILFYG